LRLVQQRWLVLMVHGMFFSRYRARHAADNRRLLILQAALTLQYYWRLRNARMLASARYQRLLNKLRKSFLFFVVSVLISNNTPCSSGSYFACCAFSLMCFPFFMCVCSDCAFLFVSSVISASVASVVPCHSCLVSSWTT
jgi:hypothetical protein